MSNVYSPGLFTKARKNLIWSKTQAERQRPFARIVQRCSRLGRNIRHQRFLELVDFVLEREFALFQPLDQQLILLRQRRGSKVFDDQIKVAVLHLKLVQGGAGIGYFLFGQHRFIHSTVIGQLMKELLFVAARILAPPEGFAQCGDSANGRRSRAKKQRQRLLE